MAELYIQVDLGAPTIQVSGNSSFDDQAYSVLTFNGSSYLVGVSTGFWGTESFVPLSVAG